MHFLLFVIMDTDTENYRYLENMMEPYNWEVWGYEPWAENEVDEDGCEYWINPDGKWDWWQVGGRWAGHIEAKDGTYGERSWTNENKPYETGHYDTCLMSDYVGCKCLPYAVLTPDKEWHQHEWYVDDPSTEYGFRREEDEEWDDKFTERFIDPYQDENHRLWVVDYHS